MTNWALVSAARMRELDRYTIETLGVAGEVLMESAGRAVLDLVLESGRDALSAPDAEVVVVCGAGNNGGDGLVVARHLALLGIRARTLLLGDPERLEGDAAINCRRARAVGCAVESAWPLARPFPQRGIVVDALFGTGLSRPIQGAAADLIEHINALRESSELRVVAVDLPSGLDADTGQIMGHAIAADATVTVNAPKIGLALEPGRRLAGEVTVARIGIADSLPGESAGDDADSVRLWTARAAAEKLPERVAAGHKGSFGHVLVVGGSRGMSGAAVLAATAAVRSGAGLVTAGCPASLNDVLEAQCAEVMTAPLPETADYALAEAALEPILALARERDVVAVGPGVGRSPETRALLHALAERVEVPLVIDADGLNAFEGSPEMLRTRPSATVLTPHPGEAARLLQSGSGEINRDRVGAARELAAITGAVVLLKGAGTVAASPEGRAILNGTGGPTLATGGSGDVLTGLVAALLAQGVEALEAAALAAYVHGLAGDRIARRRGEAGLMARELAEELPGAMQQLREEGRKGVQGSDEGSATLLRFPGS